MNYPGAGRLGSVSKCTTPTQGSRYRRMPPIPLRGLPSGGGKKNSYTGNPLFSCPSGGRMSRSDRKGETSISALYPRYLPRRKRQEILSIKWAERRRYRHSEDHAVPGYERRPGGERGYISSIDIPLTAGGGISSPEDIEMALEAGADKISMNSAAVKDPDLVMRAAEQYGGEKLRWTRRCLAVKCPGNAADALTVGLREGRNSKTQ